MRSKNLVITVCLLAIFMFSFVFPAYAKMPKYVRFASLSVGKSAYYVAVGIGSVMSKHCPIKVAVDPVGMHAAVFELVNKGEAEMGAIGTLELVPAWRGEGIYKGKPLPVLAGMTTIQMYFLIHTTPGKGIKKIQDLRGKRIMADAVPSPSVAAFSRALLKAHGMTDKDVKWMRFGKFGEAVAALKEGKCDAISYPSSIKGMQDIKLAVGYEAVPIQKEPAEKMLKELLGFTYEAMPAGYNGVVEKVTPTLAYYTSIFFRENASDEVVYTLVKAALEHSKDYARVHPLLPDVDIKRAATIVGLPFHPGAIKYFKEKGVWTAEHTKKNAELLAKFRP